MASIHGEADRLTALHHEVAARFAPGDRLVYLGNYLGYGGAVRAAVDELLAFRRALIAQPGMFAADLVYLRGSQEEMWHKLLQLQFAPNPVGVLEWMLEHGVGATLAAYGGDAKSGLASARQGPVGITRWTIALRAAMREAPGHDVLMTALKRAAFTDDNALLFVHAGIDPGRPLSTQSDSLWWASGAFSRIDAPYGGFRMVVRGFDPGHSGIVATPFTTSIDSGCGFGGPLTACCFAPSGEILDTVEA